ncbi:hypothetical protein [Rhodococcus sp. IEGM 1408]|uniref:hypothetical protein n=1 Tax=Rhodococcus sp. IEGM 1408 TaxID=3082220 RepID=UPI0029534B16|nr:hypothetical protein [Rhodococcus sp. IEGM 1408]MDV8000781.1 hypothetical protein [Rhodococcus sp. IEGM 1408]
MRSRPTRHAVVALLSAAGLVAGGGLAAADMSPMALPGTNDGLIQVALGKGLATVVVNAAGADAAEVTGTFTNESNVLLYCSDLSGGSTATVTDAAIVSQSLAFMSGNLVPGNWDNQFTAAESGSVGSLGSAGTDGTPADELAGIQQDQDRARLAGHYGTVDVGFTVEPGEEIPWSATLTVPTGDRTDFDAAALFTCRQARTFEYEDYPGEYFMDVDDQWYAFAGYEENVEQDNGSGSSLSTGSLGS